MQRKIWLIRVCAPCIVGAYVFGCEKHDELPRFTHAPRVEVSSPTTPWTSPHATPVFSTQKPFAMLPLHIEVPERHSPPLVNEWPQPRTKKKALGNPIEVMINADVDPVSPVSTGTIVLPEDEWRHTIFPDGQGSFKIASGKDFYITINRTAEFPPGTMFISDHWFFSTPKITPLEKNRLTLSVRELIAAAERAVQQALYEYRESAYEKMRDGSMIFRLGNTYFEVIKISLIADIALIRIVKNLEKEGLANPCKNGPENT